MNKRQFLSTIFPGRYLKQFHQTIFVFFLYLILIATPAFSKNATVTVGAYDNAPTVFIDNNGIVRGLFIDILENIAKREGWEIQYVQGELNALLESLQNGQIDIVPAIAYSQEAETALDYNFENVMPNWAEIYSLNSTGVKSLLHLENKKVAVKQGDIHFQTLLKMIDKFNIDCRFFEADSYRSVFEMLQANYVDLAVVDRLYGNNHKTQYGAQKTEIIFNPIELRFAVPEKKNVNITGAIDAHLVAFKSEENSIYYQAINRWLVDKTEAQPPTWLLRLLYSFLGLIVFLTFTVFVFRKQMSKKTRQLRTTTRNLQANIEERKKAQEILQRYERIVEASSDSMALLDKDQQHVLVNTRYRKTVGFKESSIAGVPLHEVLDPSVFNDELKKGVERCLQGEVVHLHTRPEEGDTKKVYWNITLNPYYSRKQDLDGFVIDIRDVTEQVKLQNRLKNSQKMEAIGMLAGGVAHDLNNILSGLVSYPDILLHKAAPDDPMTAPLKTIKKSGERAAAIVQDLLTLARRGIGNPIPVNINTIVNDFWTSPEQHNIAKDTQTIAYIFRLDDNLPNILGSPAHLGKVLMNLFTNCIEAMEDGGKLTIGTRRISFAEEYIGYETVPPGDYVELSMSDTGVGMATAELNRVFEPFYSSKKMGRSGTGLGMAVVWGVTKDHGGYLDIMSKLGVGTTFKAFFPISHLAVSSENETIPGGIEGGKESLLIIDDLEEQRSLAYEIVTALGYTAEVACSGREAVKMCEKKKYDLLLLDMIMEEDMDGYATYQQILKIWPNQKVIITSGFSESSRVKKAQQLGAGSYIKKPYSVKTLARAIRKELQ